VDCFRLSFAHAVLHVPGARKLKARRGPVQGLSREHPGAGGVYARPAHRCQGGAHRRYLPSEVFLGRLSHLMIRKPERAADGRVVMTLSV
jgi:hypothetical protein